MVNALPSFDLREYGTILDRLHDAGYQFRLIGDMRLPLSGKVTYLRHDIDLHLNKVTEVATIEAERHIQATYYVALTLHYNPHYPENQGILKQLQHMGHEVGLHYDMTTYPTDPHEARRHLDREVEALGAIVGKRVRTICMHQPHKGQADPFLDLDEYVHPLNSQCKKNLLYISDSCRAWRDESLLCCFGPDGPERVLLNTHPELWLDGTVSMRMEYLDRVVIQNGLQQHKDFFNETVRHIWLEHSAPKLHDTREAARTRSRSCEYTTGSKNG